MCDCNKKEPLLKRLSVEYNGFLAAAPPSDNADSVPPTSIFDSSWSCMQWVEWHKANVAKYGQEKANSKFMTSWMDQNSLSSDFNFCKWDADFAKYFQSQGIDTGWWLSHLYVNITDGADKAVQDTADAVDNTTKSATNLTSSISKIVKWLPYVLVGATLLGVGFFIYKTYK